MLKPSRQKSSPSLDQPVHKPILLLQALPVYILGGHRLYIPAQPPQGLDTMSPIALLDRRPAPWARSCQACDPQSRVDSNLPPARWRSRFPSRLGVLSICFGKFLFGYREPHDQRSAHTQDCLFGVAHTTAALLSLRHSSAALPCCSAIFSDKGHQPGTTRDDEADSYKHCRHDSPRRYTIHQSRTMSPAATGHKPSPQPFYRNQTSTMGLHKSNHCTPLANHFSS